MIDPDEINDLDSAREAIKQLMKMLDGMQRRIDQMEQVNTGLRQRVDQLEQENGGLRGRVKQLERENDDLRGKVDEAVRAGKRQATPFSKGEPKADPKKPGQKEGHKAEHRAIPEHVDHVKTARLPRRCECGGIITKSDQKVQYQIDIPQPIPVVVTQFDVEIGCCKRCQKRHQGRHAEQTSDALGAAGVQIGPNLFGMAAELKHVHGVSYGGVSLFISGLTRLKVCRGAFARAEQRLANKLQPTYDGLVLRLRNGAITYADETGWKVGGKPAWLWVFTDKEVTVYVIDTARDHDVVERMLGRKYKGVLKTDCFAAYDHEHLGEIEKSKCLGHLIRRGARMADEKSGPAAQFSKEMLRLLRAAIRLKERQEDLSEHGYRTACGHLESGMDRLLKRRLTDPENVTLATLLIKHRASLLNFLYMDNCDATNNAAERAIRPAVIIRKTNGCNRTDTGARVHAILGSVLQTCKKLGKNFGAHVSALMRQPGPAILGFAASEQRPM